MPNIPSPAQAGFKRNLRHGMQGQDVMYLQAWLDTLNTYYQFVKNEDLDNTGYYGDRTQRFLKKFQWFVGISPPDGYYDYRTYDMIRARYNNMVQSMGFR